MNISNGHNGAQGHALPEKHNSGAFAYGLSEDGFGKLARARKACDMLQLLFLNTAAGRNAGCRMCARHRRADGVPAVRFDGYCAQLRTD